MTQQPDVIHTNVLGDPFKPFDWKKLIETRPEEAVALIRSDCVVVLPKCDPSRLLRARLLGCRCDPASQQPVPRPEGSASDG